MGKNQQVGSIMDPDLDRTEHRTSVLSDAPPGRGRSYQQASQSNAKENVLEEVPSVISYPSLSPNNGSPHSSNPSISTDPHTNNDARQISELSGVMSSPAAAVRQMSQLTVDESENAGLLKSFDQHSKYGGTANGDYVPARLAASVQQHEQRSPSKRSILKQSLLYASLTSQHSNEVSGENSNNILLEDIQDDAVNEQKIPRNPPADPSSSTKSSSARVLRRRSSSLLSFRSNSVRLNRNYSEIVAPDDISLPPETPLLGSSRMAAQAIRQTEMGSIRSRGSRGGRSIIWGNDADHTGESLDADCGSTLATHATVRTLKEIEEEYLEKARTTFMNDAMTFAEGTIPQSIVVALVIGVVCGMVAFMYYTVLDFFLDVIWKDMPEWWVIDKWPERFYVLWIPLVTITLSALCGISIYFLGEPGDLAYTIQCVHEKGYKGTSHIIPMFVASMFTILAGASLGPEAPLVAICAATAGFISRKIFKQKNRNVVRKHTFMGMSGALSAFFGVPLGGSIFALEVTSRFGVEYFEHLIEAIFAGEISVVVFRWLAGLPLGAIWKISDKKLEETEPWMIVVGAGIGLLGAGLAFLWANFHWHLMGYFKDLGLLDDSNTFALPRCLLGAVAIASIGMLVPHTMFWGEFEIGTIATLSPASDLPHVWPTNGLIGFEMDSWQNCLIVGICKFIAISFTVAGGYRGGYIFPFFAAGAAFGRALCFAFPQLSPSIATLCFAAAINVAITRTALATSLILASLSGEQCVLPPVLAASIVSLFATGYVPFIKSQLARSDIDFSLYYRRNRRPMVQDSIRLPKGQVLDQELILQES